MVVWCVKKSKISSFEGQNRFVCQLQHAEPEYNIEKLLGKENDHFFKNYSQLIRRCWILKALKNKIWLFSFESFHYIEIKNKFFNHPKIFLFCQTFLLKINDMAPSNFLAQMEVKRNLMKRKNHIVELQTKVLLFFTHQTQKKLSCILSIRAIAQRDLAFMWFFHATKFKRNNNFSKS